MRCSSKEKMIGILSGIVMGGRVGVTGIGSRGIVGGSKNIICRGDGGESGAID